MKLFEDNDNINAHDMTGWQIYVSNCFKSDEDIYMSEDEWKELSSFINDCYENSSEEQKNKILKFVDRIDSQWLYDMKTLMKHEFPSNYNIVISTADFYERGDLMKAFRDFPDYFSRLDMNTVDKDILLFAGDILRRYRRNKENLEKNIFDYITSYKYSRSIRDKAFDHLTISKLPIEKVKLYMDKRLEEHDMETIYDMIEQDIPIPKIIEFKKACLAGNLDRVEKDCLCFSIGKLTKEQFIEAAKGSKEKTMYSLLFDYRRDNRFTINDLFSALKDSDYSFAESDEIFEGIKHNLPLKSILLYADPSKFFWRQMEEIRLGLEAWLDVSEYCNSEMSSEEMRTKRISMIDELLMNWDKENEQ